MEDSTKHSLRHRLHYNPRSSVNRYVFPIDVISMVCLRQYGAAPSIQKFNKEQRHLQSDEFNLVSDRYSQN